ncbi:MAG: 4-(cytidine 5-diphospho)-2-C-methyl-D-erythritol kinase [Bacteroidota bacterium]|jgi:4-diphosphocytidyl-2-C-methyl-D-erythritol kinase
MILFPHAKINIGLYITEKRADGFHNLESAFFPVQWNDILEITPADSFEFVSTGIPIPGNNDQNLCVKAFQLLQEKYQIPNVCIQLHKIIPMGAGLGGGSSDAAFTLMGLRDLFHLTLSNHDLIPFAKQLGSDCTFFLCENPQFGTEKGDVLEELPISLKGYFGLLIYPNVGVSTKEAYAGVRPQKAPYYLPDALKQPIVNWENSVKNDFENSIFPKYPILKEIKQRLYEMGAVYASMSGSGSTLFGIFHSTPNPEWFEEQNFITKIVEF